MSGPCATEIVDKVVGQGTEETEEEDELSRRRRINREAAARARRRAKENQSDLKQKVLQLESEKTSLKYENYKLQQEVKNLHKVIEEHLKTCSHAEHLGQALPRPESTTKISNRNGTQVEITKNGSQKRKCEDGESIVLSSPGVYIEHNGVATTNGDNGDHIAHKKARVVPFSAYQNVNIQHPTTQNLELLANSAIEQPQKVRQVASLPIQGGRYFARAKKASEFAQGTNGLDFNDTSVQLIAQNNQPDTVVSNITSDINVQQIGEGQSQFIDQEGNLIIAVENSSVETLGGDGGTTWTGNVVLHTGASLPTTIPTDDPAIVVAENDNSDASLQLVVDGKQVYRNL